MPRLDEFACRRCGAPIAWTVAANGHRVVMNHNTDTPHACPERAKGKRHKRGRDAHPERTK